MGAPSSQPFDFFPALGRYLVVFVSSCFSSRSSPTLALTPIGSKRFKNFRQKDNIQNKNATTYHTDVTYPETHKRNDDGDGHYHQYHIPVAWDFILLRSGYMSASSADHR